MRALSKTSFYLLLFSCGLFSCHFSPRTGRGTAEQMAVRRLCRSAYGLNFNFPENHRWRSKETTPHTNELAPNMGALYLEKDPTQKSNWVLNWHSRQATTHRTWSMSRCRAESSPATGLIPYHTLREKTSATWRRSGTA